MNSGDDRATTATTLGDAERLDAIRRRILNVIGHELRTPVTTIRGLAESLETAETTTIRTTLGPALVRNARRVERLLDDLLVASEVTTALPVGRAERVSTAAMAREAWAGLSTGADALDVVGSADAYVPPQCLRMALDRVLENALRYGEPPVRLEISEAGGTVRLAVATPGPALHPEEVELAVEPFFRGERAVMTRPGMGLGLSVARAVIEQASGRLWVEAGAAGGLTTFIEVPAA